MIKILKYGQVANKDIFARVEPKVNVEQIVADIIADVRANGDAALYKYCEMDKYAEYVLYHYLKDLVKKQGNYDQK